LKSDRARVQNPRVSCSLPYRFSGAEDPGAAAQREAAYREVLKIQLCQDEHAGPEAGADRALIGTLVGKSSSALHSGTSAAAAPEAGGALPSSVGSSVDSSVGEGGI